MYKIADLLISFFYCRLQYLINLCIICLVIQGVECVFMVIDKGYVSDLFDIRGSEDEYLYSGGYQLAVFFGGYGCKEFDN